MMMRRTKIICTIGPASDNPAILGRMIRAGMDAARLNFSHGTHAQHKKTISLIRQQAKKEGKTITILQDLQGPKIRIGDIGAKALVLKKGQIIELPVTYRNLYKDVKTGARVLIDDGLIEARYLGGKAGFAKIKIISGGVLLSHKGMNFPNAVLKVSPVTQKDKDDLVFGLLNCADWIAVSFMSSASQVRSVKNMIKKHARKGAVLPKVMVKIETSAAVGNFDEILREADGIMIARGDLGVEIAPEKVPVLQKKFIAKCMQEGKPVVVATQMLDSMIVRPRPTRAEISDIENAVIDHADAVMLSGETAVGKYPVESVGFMDRAVRAAEASNYDNIMPKLRDETASMSSVVSSAIHHLWKSKQISAVISTSALGELAEMINAFRPEVPIFIAVGTEHEAGIWNLRSGVAPVVVHNNYGNFAGSMVKMLLHSGRLKKGQAVATVLYENGKINIKIIKTDK